MSKLIVAEIKEGTVIDHIISGRAILLVEMLNLAHHPHPLSMATCLESKKLGKKDILKIAGRYLTPDEETKIALISPEATISWIESGKIKMKKNALLPKEIHGLFSCPNAKCISSHEPRFSHFLTSSKKKGVTVTCSYCREKIPLTQVTSGGFYGHDKN